MIAIRSFLLAALLIGNAQAVDYTINLPVKVAAATDDLLPLSARCVLVCTSSTPGCPQTSSGLSAFAQQYKQLPIVEGAYSGTLSFVFKLTDQQALMPLTYRCDFFSSGSNVKSNKAKPNSGSVLNVEGKVQ